MTSKKTAIQSSMIADAILLAFTVTVMLLLYFKNFEITSCQKSQKQSQKQTPNKKKCVIRAGNCSKNKNSPFCIVVLTVGTIVSISMLISILLSAHSLKDPSSEENVRNKNVFGTCVTLLMVVLFAVLIIMFMCKIQTKFIGRIFLVLTLIVSTIATGFHLQIAF